MNTEVTSLLDIGQRACSQLVLMPKKLMVRVIPIFCERMATTLAEITKLTVDSFGGGVETGGGEARGVLVGAVVYEMSPERDRKP